MHRPGLLACQLFLLMAPVAAEAADLAAPDIRARLIGQPLHWMGMGGRGEGALYLDTDGTARMSGDGLVHDETGHWRLDGDRLCTRWQTARSGVEKCYFVSTESGQLYSTTGGNLFEVLAPGA